MIQKNPKNTRSVQHKFWNRRIINSLQESLSGLWIIIVRAVPGGEHFSHWVFWTTYIVLAVLEAIALFKEEKKKFPLALLGFLASSEN